ncbi:MAG: hypothetical protein RR400_00560 [Clostridia bacterium]
MAKKKVVKSKNSAIGIVLSVLLCCFAVLSACALFFPMFSADILNSVYNFSGIDILQAMNEGVKLSGQSTIINMILAGESAAALQTIAIFSLFATLAGVCMIVSIMINLLSKKNKKESKNALRISALIATLFSTISLIISFANSDLNSMVYAGLFVVIASLVACVVISFLPYSRRK